MNGFFTIIWNEITAFNPMSVSLVVWSSSFSRIPKLRTHLGQVPDVVGVEEELLQGTGVPQDLLGHLRQGAVALVHELHLPVAALEDGNALEHARLRPRRLWLLLFGRRLAGFSIVWGGKRRGCSIVTLARFDRRMSLQHLASWRTSTVPV